MAKTRMLKIIEDDSNRELIKWLEILDTVKIKRSLFSKKIQCNPPLRKFPKKFSWSGGLPQLDVFEENNLI